VRYKPTSTDRARLARQRLPQPPDSAIDFSDIPEASPAQLRLAQRARATRVNRGGRPPLGDQKRIAISFRIDPELLAKLRTVAAARGVGYQTLAHELLEEKLRKVAAAS
jgi:uncharacterized protein (DUF4415 family)